MELELKRIFKCSCYVIGQLSINGVLFCDTLEDAERKEKIAHQTCIAAGTYEVILNYSNRFKRLMPLLLNVPFFKGIRIHAGNRAKDTSGCILVGKNTHKGRLTQSKDTFDRLFEMLSATGEKIVLTICF